jgi:hypothetical protein
LHTCKEGAWKEKERLRLASKLKKWKGPGEFTEVSKPMDPTWHCPQFLTFQHLALPAGARECRKVFLLTGGSGPVKGVTKISNRKGEGFDYHAYSFPAKKKKRVQKCS